MTNIEMSMDEALDDLRMIRGALSCVPMANAEDAGDYLGMCGQKMAMVNIVKDQLKDLDRVIQSLKDVVPHQEN